MPIFKDTRPDKLGEQSRGGLIDPNYQSEENQDAICVVLVQSKLVRNKRERVSLATCGAYLSAIG